MKARLIWLIAVVAVVTGCTEWQMPWVTASSSPCDRASLTNPTTHMARPGIGGTGIEVARPGIGGTGIDPGGIGGTGIVGVITGFASICVNGVEVHYDAGTPVSSNGVLSSAADLAVGQVVRVNATGKGTELKAQSIDALYAVIGPVQAVNAQQRRLTVLNQSLRVDADIDVSHLAPGQWVQASGHRLSNGEIMSGSLQRIAPQSMAQLNGRITGITADALIVEGVRIALGALPMPVGATLGIEVQATGVWDGKKLQAQQIFVRPTLSRLASGQQVLLQGFVQNLNEREIGLGYGQITLGSDVRVSRDSNQQASQTAGLAVNQRVQISGRIDAQQRIVADRISVQAESGDGGSGKSGGRSGSNSGSGSGSGSGSSNSGKGSSSSGSGSSGSNSGSSSSGSNSGSNSGGSGGGSGGGGGRR
jgi:Domain of unknown function (DUF5666)